MITLCMAEYEKISIKHQASEKGSKTTTTTLFVPPRGVQRVFLMGTLHGREWISPASLIMLAHIIAESALEGNQQMIELLKTNEIIILPIVNPDGYEFTRTPASKNEQARQWRKNRRLLPCKGEKCVHGKLLFYYFCPT